VKNRYTPRLFNLNDREYLAICRFAAEKSLGPRGISAALRMIIREWLILTNRTLPLPPQSVDSPDQNPKQKGSL